MSETGKAPRKEFQVNWQVAVILAITFVALAIPLFGVALLAKSYFARPQPPAASTAPNTTALAETLERVSETSSLGAATRLEEEEVSLKIVTGDIPGRARQIVALTEQAGGSVLEGEPAADGSRRFVLHVAQSRRELLRRAILGENAEVASVPIDGDAVLLNVELRAP